MSNTGRRLLAFGAFELDPGDGLLFRHGEVVPLSPKALQTLIVLVESGGRLMTKDELMKAIWPDTFVEEHNLTLNIHTIRKALNAGGGSESFIATVPKRGYRFVAEVREVVVPTVPPVSVDCPNGMTSNAARAVPPGVSLLRHRPAWTAAIVTAGLLTLAGVAASHLIGRGGDVDDGPELARLTNNTADDHQPDASPDGQHIVFVSNRDGGKNEIYLMDADGRHPRNLTNDPANDDTPAWSPDGRHIAFQSDRRGPIEIFTMDADGANPRPLAHGGRAAWSPDGQQIAYQSVIDGHTEIFTIGATGGTPRRLTYDRAFAGDPTWSPDGKRLAFTARKDDFLQIDVMSLDGAGRSTLTMLGNNSLPAWSRDNRILFTSDRDGIRALYEMEADGGLQHRLMMEDGAEGGWWPGDRAVVFQSERDGNSEIYRVRLLHEPDGAVRLTHHVASDDNPSWSPDGKWIAFSSNRDGKPNIFVMDADGGQVHNVSRSSANDTAPAWSRQDQLAFVSDRASGPAIYVMNPTGTGTRRVTDAAPGVAPHWSPDGQSLCFERDRQIWIASLPQGATRRVAAGLTCDWSPDGARILFDVEEPGRREIYSVSSSGGTPVALSHNGHGNGGPVWSPDGLRIAFNSNQDGYGFGLFLMRPDGSQQIRITGRHTFDEHPAWSPDGRWIAFNSGRDGNDEIYKIAAR